MEKERIPGGNQGPENYEDHYIDPIRENQQLLQVDLRELKTFFDSLFCKAKDGFISVRGFKMDGGIAFSAESYVFDDPELLPAANRLATYAAATPGVVVCSPTATFNNSEKARGEDVINGVALSVDLDNTHPQKARELLEMILGPATIVVASGGEWQDNETGEFLPKLHLHWRLVNPTTTPEEHLQLNTVRKFAAKVVKGDSSAGPLAHPMRLPGSWHTKAQPKMCRILHNNNDAEINLNDAQARLKNYLNQQESSTKTQNKSSDNPQNGSHSSINTKYGMASLFEEMAHLANTSKGERNNCLNRGAFCLGQLVASGDLNELYVSNSLLAAATSIGLTQSEAKQTIKNGLESGKCKPRATSEKEKSDGTQSKISFKTFPFIKAGDLKINPPKWIVEDYLEKNTLSVVFGDPGSGKTFIALSLAASVATGFPWNSQNVKQGSVFYIVGEGFNGISRRLAAWSKYHQFSLTDAPLFISEGPAQLLDVENAKLVAKTINILAKNHGPPKLVIIDTLARNLGIGNENSTQDMSAFISIVDRYIRIPFNCCVLIVHHTGHADKDRARGSIALKGALDAEYGVEKKDNTVTMTTTKMKEAEIPEPISFLLKSIEIELVDEKNRPITSAILEPTDFIHLDLEKIRDIIPAEGINQTNLFTMMKTKFKIPQNKAKNLLKNGVGKYWNIIDGLRNASIYTLLFSFSGSNEHKTEKQTNVDDEND